MERNRKLWKRLDVSGSSEYSLEFSCTVRARNPKLPYKDRTYFLETSEGDRKHFPVLYKAKDAGEMLLQVWIERMVRRMGGEVVWKPWRP